MSIQHLVCSIRIRHQVLQSHCTEEQVLKGRRYVGARSGTQIGAGSWRIDRPDAMNEEDISFALRSSNSGAAGRATLASQRAVASQPLRQGEATPHPASDKYSQHAVSHSVRRGRWYEAVARRAQPRRCEGSSRSEGQLRHHPGAAPRLVPGRLHVTCFTRAQSIFRRRRSYCRRRLVSHHPHPVPVSRETRQALVSRETAIQPK
jgi:hypothetical protein